MLALPFFLLRMQDVLSLLDDQSSDASGSSSDSNDSIVLEKRNKKWKGEEGKEHELHFDELERFVGFDNLQYILPLFVLNKFHC